MLRGALLRRARAFVRCTSLQCRGRRPRTSLVGNELGIRLIRQRCLTTLVSVGAMRRGAMPSKTSAAAPRSLLQHTAVYHMQLRGVILSGPKKADVHQRMDWEEMKGSGLRRAKEIFFDRARREEFVDYRFMRRVINEAEEPRQAVLFVREVWESGVLKPSLLPYVNVLKLCKNDPRLANDVYCEMKSYNLEATVEIYCLLIQSTGTDEGLAIWYLREMDRANVAPNNRLFHSLLGVLAHHGFEKCDAVYRKYRSEFMSTPDVCILRTMIKASGKNLAALDYCTDELVELGLGSDRASFLAVMNRLRKGDEIGNITFMYSQWDKLRKAGLRLWPKHLVELARAARDHPHMLRELAAEFCAQQCDIPVRRWNEMIEHCHMHFDLTMSLFREMLKRDLTPNKRSFRIVLETCPDAREYIEIVTAMRDRGVRFRKGLKGLMEAPMARMTPEDAETVRADLDANG